MRSASRVGGFGNVAAAFLASRCPHDWQGLAYAARLLVAGLRTARVLAPPHRILSTVGRRGERYEQVSAIADRLGLPRSLLALASLVNNLEGAWLAVGRTNAISSPGLTVISLDASCVDSGRVPDVLRLYGSLPGVVWMPYGHSKSVGQFTQFSDGVCVQDVFTSGQNSTREVR